MNRRVAELERVKFEIKEWKAKAERAERLADRHDAGFRAMCEAFERLEDIVGIKTDGGMGPAPALNTVEQIVREREALAAHNAELITAGDALVHELGFWQGAECVPRTREVRDDWRFAAEASPATSLARHDYTRYADALENAASDAATAETVEEVVGMLQMRAAACRHHAERGDS